MSEALSASAGAQLGHALLFTDPGGYVIFANDYLVRLVNRFGVRAILREPLHRVIGIDLDLASTLLYDVGHGSQIKDRPLEIRNVAGEVVPVACTALPTYDNRKAFIGAEMTLTPTAPDASLVHSTTAETHIPILDHVQLDQLNVYFVKQLDALRKLVVRVGGDRLGAALLKVLDETAHRNNWPASFEEGAYQVNIGLDCAEVYRGLLARAYSYAAGMIGEKLVSKEVHGIDSQIDEVTLKLVDSVGMRGLLP